MGTSSTRIHLWAALCLVLLQHVSLMVTARSSCSAGCKGGTANYAAGRVYVYEIEGTTRTSLPDTKDEAVTLQFHATAEVSGGQDCSATLKLKDVRVTGPGGQKYDSLRELEQHPVGFTSIDGKVDSQLCTVEGDNAGALNIKRAAISLLQVFAKQSSKVYEWDVFGKCPSSVIVDGSKNDYTVTLTRNLNECYQRESINYRFQSTPYYTQSGVQSSPLLASTQSVSQKVVNGIVQTASSVETYLFRPLSNQDTGAKTVVETKLKSKSQRSGSLPAGAATVARSIVFELPREGSLGKSSADAVSKALNRAANTMTVTVGTDSAKEFRSLLKVVRRASKDDLLTIFNQVKTGAGFAHSPRKLFQDALLQAGTGEAVEVVVELLKSHDITGDVAKLWFSTLSFVRQPSLNSLAAVSTLLDEPNLSYHAYFGIGSLAGRYCSNHNCEGNSVFTNLLQKLAHGLASGCKVSSRDQEDKLIVSLKALGNVHHLTDGVSNSIQRCYADSSAPTRVRVAALETALTDACKHKKAALSLLENVQEDSELRIKAYLVVVQCPSGKAANSLKLLLEKENINQVGSFIVSHLRNLRATSNPERQAAKEQLGEVRTTRRFPEDFRKFSRNLELSGMLYGPNLGYTAESNIIHSQKSFLPRSVSWNLTTNVFGHSYNILELGLRGENVERLLERYVGPRGYYTVTEPEEVIYTNRNRFLNLVDRVKQRFQQTTRAKRSTNQQLYSTLKRAAKSLGPDYNDNHIDLDFSTKVFGSEVGWKNLGGCVEDFTPEQAIDEYFNTVDQGIKRGKNIDVDERHHITFLDLEIAYPTALGFALKLAASGSAAVHLQVNSNADLSAIVKDHNNAAFFAKVVPSVSVEVNGELLLDAYAVESGLNLKGSLHLATGSEVNVKTVQGKKLDVKVELPLQKQEFNIGSTVVSIVRERDGSEHDKELTFKTEKKQYSGCFDQLSSLVGLTVCGSVSVPWDLNKVPNTFFPLNGPASLVIQLEAKDVPAYHITIEKNLHGQYEGSVKLSFDTPGSQINRKLEVLLTRQLEPEYKLAASFSSPRKTVSASLYEIDNSQEYSWNAKFVHDQQEYFARVGAKKSGSESHQVYTPLLEYRAPGVSHDLSGGNTEAGFGCKGTVTVDRTDSSRKYTLQDVTIQTPKGSLKVDGTLVRQKNLYDSNLKFTINDDVIIYKSKFQHTSPSKFTVEAQGQSRKYPELGVDFKWNYHREKNSLKNSLVVTHGNDLNSERNRITLEQSAKYRFDNYNSFDLGGEIKFEYPAFGTDVELKAAATPKSLSYDVGIEYDGYKIGSELDFKKDIKQPGDFDVDFSVEAGDKRIELDLKREVTGKDKSKITAELEVKPGSKYELSSDIVHTFKQNNINLHHNSVLRVSGRSDDVKLVSGLVVNHNEIEFVTELSSGRTQHLDVTWKFDKVAENPSGSIKVFVNGLVDANAHYKYVPGGKVGATLNIDLPKQGRKIKGTADLTITGTNHVASLDLFWDIGRDPSRKLHFTSESDIKANSIDSKNTFVLRQEKITFNFKGSLTGKLTNGHVLGSVELTLPRGEQLVVKVDRNLKRTEDRVELEGKGDVMLRDAQGGTNSLSVDAKLIAESKNVLLDSFLRLNLKTSKGKELSINLKLKDTPAREKRELEGELDIESTQFDPLKLGASADVTQKEVVFKAHGSYGSDIAASTAGTLGLGEGGKVLVQDEKGVRSVEFTLENTLDVKLPAEKTRTVKYYTKMDVKVKRNTVKIDSLDDVTVNGDKNYKLIVRVDAQQASGNSFIEVSLPGDKPRSVATTWHSNTQSGEVREGGTLTAKWGDKQEATTTFELAVPSDESGVDLHITANAPKLGSTELKIKGKVSHVSPKFIQTSVGAVWNDKKVDFDGTVSESSFKFFPNIDCKLVGPHGTSKVYVSLKQSNENDVLGDAELQWTLNKEGNLKLHVDAKLVGIDNFYVKLDADSQALQLNKWNIIAQSRRAKGKSVILLSATSGGKNVLDGRLNYNHVEKPNFYQFVVYGNVKFYEKQTQAKLDASFSRLTKEINKEDGSETKVKFILGEKTYDGIFKLTNQELFINHELCKKQGQCSVIKWNSKTEVNEEETSLKHVLVVVVDLRSAGVPERLEATATTVINPSIPFDHKLVLKLIKNQETSYVAHAYIKKDESGVVITLPERVIAGKVQHHISADKSNSLDVSVVGNFWLDQARKPDQKTSLVFKFKADNTNRDLTFSSEAKLTDPALGKDYSVTSDATFGGTTTNIVTATVNLDIFKDPGQETKVTLQVTETKHNEGDRVDGAFKIFSQGLELDISLIGHTEVTISKFDTKGTFSYIDVKHATKQLIAKLAADKNGLTAEVKGPDSVLLSIDSKFQVPSDGTLKTQTVIRVVTIEPLMLLVDVKATPSLFVQLYKQRQPNAKVELKVVLDIFSEFAVLADTINNGVKKELVKMQMSLSEDKFLKTDVSWSSENFLKFVDVCTSELDVARHLKEAALSLGQEATTEFKALGSVLRQARPDFKPLLQSYQRQLKELKEELADDQGIKELSDYLTKLVARVRQSVAEVLEKFTEALQVMTERLEKIHDSLTEMWEKLLPEFQKSYVKVVEVLTGVYEDVEAVLLTYLRAIGKLIQGHEEDLKKFVSVFTDVLEEIGKVIGKTVIQIRNDVKEVFDLVIQQIQNLPKLDVLKEKLKQVKEEIDALQLPQNIWIWLQEFVLIAKEMAPTPELKDFIQTLEQYIEKNIYQQNVDQVEEIKELDTKARAAIKSVIALLTAYLGDTKETEPTLLGLPLPTTLVDILKIPQLFLFHLSPLKYFTSDDLPTLKELLITYRPRLNPLDWFPPYKAIGVVVDGQHFFTFDQRHFTFKGSCPYILVTDVVDSNFSVVLKVENGKLKSLLLTDDKDSIEVQEDRTLLVNGVPSEYPAHAGSLSAWRRYHWLSIKSDSGVIIDQDYRTGSVVVRLSGFYFGRTRGLLGTLSYEQGDDFLQSNNELTENVNDFANSWKVGQCQDVRGAVHSVPKTPQCTELFTSGSILSFGFPIVSPVQYRDACDQAVETAGSPDAKNKAACRIAAAYIVTASAEGIPLKVPDKCGHCDVVGQSQVEAGTQFSVRTAHAPHKAADIVIIVEQSLATEELFKELVTPLTHALTTDLKSRGITDVVVHLMGWSADQEWPQHYTTGGKLVFEGSAKNLHFYKSREELPRQTQEDKIRWFVHELEVELGLTQLSEATWEFLDYPYRAGASKAVIYVTGQPAEVGQLTGGIFQTVRMAVLQQWLNLQGIFPFVITPVDGLKITSKDTRALKNIVGFDEERVYSLTDGKKKQGNTELRKVLDYKQNPTTWLPQGTDGITFVAQNFIDNKPQRRQYMQTVSHRISELLASEFYEDCVCLIRSGLYPESFCRVTGRKERETKRPRTKG